MAVVVRRFAVYLIVLDPTVGSEMQKTRPGLVVSPDEMNASIATVIIAPMTTRGRTYPTRVPCEFQGKHGEIALDQIRVVDKARLVRHLGSIDVATQQRVLDTLAAMFAP
jgi:mRNA interferase MazF